MSIWSFFFPMGVARRAFTRTFINPKIMKGMRKAGLFPTYRALGRRRFRRGKKR